MRGHELCNWQLYRLFPDILECFVRIEGEVLQPRGWEVGGHKQSVNIPPPVRVGARS